jgi:hypothetical protein
MKLGAFATIRTGLVLSRKETREGKGEYMCRALNLRSVDEDGQVLAENLDVFYAVESLKSEYFTCEGDVLVRLSAPYTAVLIGNDEAGLLVPSHFAIIRTGGALNPAYLHWWLNKSKKSFSKFASGSSTLGTISTGNIAEMTLKPPPIEQQSKIGELLHFARKEQQLLSLLAEKRGQLVDALALKMDNEEGELLL